MDTFDVTVNYDLPFKEAISVGKYDWVDQNITLKNFAWTTGWTAKFKLYLVSFGYPVTTAKIEELSAEFRLAALPELLAFGAQFPDRQREFAIVALGSPWAVPNGSHRVTCLYGDTAVRNLGLYWDAPENKWEGCCKFLMLRKWEYSAQKALQRR